MGGYGGDARLVKARFVFLRGIAVQARQLHGLVAHGLQLLKGAQKILFRVVAGGINLIADLH